MTPGTSANLRNRGPLFMELRLLQATLKKKLPSNWFCSHYPSTCPVTSNLDPRVVQ